MKRSKSNLEKASDSLAENQSIRILAIVKGIYQSCLKEQFQSADIEEMPELPQWAKNICEQLHRTIFKRLVDLKPVNERIEWRNFGCLLGVCHRESTFLINDAASEVDTLADLNVGVLDSLHTGMAQTRR